MALPDVVRSDRIAPRIPFFTPVISSGLAHCWATNISKGGMGLTAISTGTTHLQRGDDLEVEFPLGDLSLPVRAVARVAWTSNVRPDGRLGFGVQFRELSTRAGAEIEMFVAEHRPRVIVAMPDGEERELAERTLGDLDIHVVESADELTPEALRMCASIIVFAHEPDRLTAFLERLWRMRPDAGIVPGELPLAPITLCTSVDSERLLPFLGEGRVNEVLRPPFDRRMLMLAAERSCERWALQLEVRWASLQLEGMARDPQQRPVLRDPEVAKHGTHIVRVSSQMERVYDLIRTVAVHDVPVLLIGETGTGKELAAREIHARSRRSNTMFVAQDCGALTETLLESELFGHVRGAFTGATHDHPGLFQIANGGTIFLDEIQNTSPTLQAKLLRVVEQGEVRPVGGTKPRRVDVRLIAACNVDLRQAVREQRFRADFYYRLNRFPIELPPLREHVDDVAPLTSYFMAALCEAFGRPVHRVEPRVEAALAAYDWPGNIRELKNAIERALLLTPVGEPLRWAALPEEVRGTGELTVTAGHTLDEQVAAFERRLISAALERNDGVIRRAARDLTVNAVTLARKMKRLGLTGAE
ncbi:MAG: sigma 54-interacting transcriptional regulator [Deltaproteobacteria bacterium]|nr:sigma 54-interacting transcriptional regulator [Deltaproteobacteria bacterium]MCW5805516.1 sigma 54-interacting transcriptional regulator [Deltaproteobacteria bacterium]